MQGSLPAVGLSDCVLREVNYGRAAGQEIVIPSCNGCISMESECKNACVFRFRIVSSVRVPILIFVCIIGSALIHRCFFDLQISLHCSNFAFMPKGRLNIPMLITLILSNFCSPSADLPDQAIQLMSCLLEEQHIRGFETKHHP